MIDFCELGDVFVKLRKRKGLKAYKLSEISGLSKKTISRIENGNENVTLKSLDTLAESLGYRLDITFKNRRIK